MQQLARLHAERASDWFEASEQLKVHLHGGFGGYWFAVEQPRPKAPARNGFHRFLIQAQAETLLHMDVANIAARVHFDAQDHYALMFRLACLLGEFRFHFVQELRGRDATPAMNGANSGRPRLRFADSLAAAVVSDPIHSVRAQSAVGQSAEGSPRLVLLVASIGMSNAIVIGSASCGCGLEVGGMKVRRAVGGGEPCLAGSEVWLLPPLCASTALRGRKSVNGVA
jgi:hypothetical protein